MPVTVFVTVEVSVGVVVSVTVAYFIRPLAMENFDLSFTAGHDANHTVVVSVTFVLPGGGVTVLFGVTVVFLVYVRGMVKEYDEVLTGFADLVPRKVLHRLVVE